MRFREFWLMLVLVGVSTIGALAFGEHSRLAFLAILGVVGLGATIRVMLLRRALEKSIAAMNTDAQEHVLLLPENSAIRPELVAQLPQTAPPVPLRGGRESTAIPILRVSQ